jgi:2,4-dienoyl-CoA reductase-like NADH-dependent reductase (Old Yellow Enzyme family)
LVDCSSGGNDPRQQIPIHPGYQIPFSAAIRKTVGIMTGAVGMIHSPDLAESVLANSEADIVILGRTLLADPVWPLRAANQLKAMGVKWPHQYERGNIF